MRIKAFFVFICLGILITNNAFAQTIEITNAQYVANGSTKYCNATSSVRSYCEGQSSCKFPVNNQLCGDPLPGTPKTLSVYFKCGGKADGITVPEASEGSINCK